MNRHIFFQVTAPALLMGLILIGTSLGSAWSINRLQTNLASILSEHVTSVQASLDLENATRQLRYHSLLYLTNPTPELREQITADEEAFQQAFALAQRSVTNPVEQHYLDQIQSGFRQYDREMSVLRDEVARTGPKRDFPHLARTHPIKHIVKPCQSLEEFNRDQLDQMADESNQLSRQTRNVMLFLGLAGPAGGLIAGYGIARGLARSMMQLEERVRQQREEIQRGEQLAAVGQLAAGVAHEIRNPLTGMKLLVEAALRPSRPRALSEADLRVIHDEIVRLEETVKQFLDFARPPALVRKCGDLRKAVERPMELVRTRARHQGVTLRLETPEIPVLVAFDAGQVHAVLVNLLLNSLDALPEGGDITVSLDTLEGKARIVVRDTGPGLAPEIRARLFTPFASTKTTGTGLGLSLARRIIEDHGGSIVADHPVTGASFTILLPLSDA